jgi:hypothetical protein
MTEKFAGSKSWMVILQLTIEYKGYTRKSGEPEKTNRIGDSVPRETK